MELGEYEGELRLYDSNTSQWLQTSPERADNAEARADNAEAELAKALKEIERLRAEKND